ncbi:MAG: inorganic phosphate transporter, partial [Elusimicrobia bacterium]|nr:inorganic phosphate transporter [Elusimicrobiota bacterium]
MFIAIALLAMSAFLAGANGANDVSKGVATLVGSGVASYRKAVWWGSGWTVVGAILAAFFSYGLVSTFSGKGILTGNSSTPIFLISVAVGAGSWILFASRTGLPVSTTHALLGALCGIGVWVYGPQGLLWQAVLKKTFLPLLLSPFLSLGLMMLLFPFVRLSLTRFNRYCVCLEKIPAVRLELAAGTVPLPAVPSPSTFPTVVLDRASACVEAVARVGVLDGLHWITAGITSLARGVNDTPKIVAIGFVAVSLLRISPGIAFGVAALAMGIGSLWGGLRVTETLAEKVTRMSTVEGFASSLTTAVLVLMASWLSLPVSTTHVSTGAI